MTARRGHSHEMQGKNKAKLLERAPMRIAKAMMPKHLRDVRVRPGPGTHIALHSTGHGPNLPCGCVVHEWSAFVFNNWPPL